MSVINKTGCGHDGHGRAAADSSNSATLNCRKGSEECNRGKIDKFLIELYPLQFKILIIYINTFISINS